MEIKFSYSSALTGTLNYLANGDLQVKNAVLNKTFSKNSMQAIAKEFKGVNRIHKPTALLFWTDCKNGKHKNWVK